MGRFTGCIPVLFRNKRINCHCEEESTKQSHGIVFVERFCDCYAPLRCARCGQAKKWDAPGLPIILYLGIKVSQAVNIDAVSCKRTKKFFICSNYCKASATDRLNALTSTGRVATTQNSIKFCGIIHKICFCVSKFLTA